MMLKCLCNFSAGRSVHYTDLREHFTKHVREAIEEAVRQTFMLELIMVRGETGFDSIEWKKGASEVRMQLIDALALWDEKARPALDKRFPHDALKEALDL